MLNCTDHFFGDFVERESLLLSRGKSSSLPNRHTNTGCFIKRGFSQSRHSSTKARLNHLYNMVKDRFHDVVRTALEKDDWEITADPYEVSIDDVDFEIDLAAEQLLAAERENQKIAVEVKSFIGSSNVSEFHTALGQFLNYRDALARIEPDRQLYLAVRVPVYESFFQRRFITAAVERYQIRLVIYDVKQEVIVQWL